MNELIDWVLAQLKDKDRARVGLCFLILDRAPFAEHLTKELMEVLKLERVKSCPVLPDTYWAEMGYWFALDDEGDKERIAILKLLKQKYEKQS